MKRIMDKMKCSARMPFSSSSSLRNASVPGLQRAHVDAKSERDHNGVAMVLFL